MDGVDPYDALQIDLSHVGHPTADWHPAALLGIVEQACAGPLRNPRNDSRRVRSQLEHDIVVTTAAARLGELGLDIDGIVRSAYGSRCVMKVVIRGSILAYRREHEGKQLEGREADLCEFIIDLVGPPSPDASVSQYFAEQVTRRDELEPFIGRLERWVAEAEIADLLSTRMPRISDLPHAGTRVHSGIFNDSEWLVDRLRSTYLDQWKTASLHREYRYIRDGAEGPTPSAILAFRTVDQTKLDQVIAERAVRGETGSAGRTYLLEEAVGFLRQGKFDRAVTLFAGARAVSPDDWTLNCMSFCLVPIDPARARRTFEQLLDAGFMPPLVRANLAAVERLLGNDAAARTHAQSGLALLDTPVGPTTYLWKITTDGPVLAEDQNLRTYLRSYLSPA